MPEIEADAQYRVTLKRAVQRPPFPTYRRGDYTMTGATVQAIIDQEGEDVVDARRL